MNVATLISGRTVSIHAVPSTGEWAKPSDLSPYHALYLEVVTGIQKGAMS